MLAIVDPNQPFVVETDVSDFTIGVALFQDGRPIAFENKLLETQMLYPTQEKELLAVFHALKMLRLIII